MTVHARFQAIVAGALLALALPAAASPRVPPASEEPSSLVRWDDTGDFASMLVRAGKAHKLVFVDFYASWCGPCKMLDRTVYTDAVAAASANQLLSRKIDAEKGEGVALATRYAVHYYPTLVVLDATGKEIARQTGYLPADRFARFLDDAREDKGTAAQLAARIAKGDDTLDNRVALAHKATDARDFATARAQLEAVAAKDTAQAATLALALVRAEAAADDHASVLADGPAFRARWPAHAQRFEVLELEANAFAARAEKDSAVARFRASVAQRPDQAEALAAFARFCATQRAALDEGLAAAQKAVTLSGGKAAGPLDALADVYAARGQFDLAVDTAQKALDLNPNDGGRRGRLETFQEQAVEALHAPPAASGKTAKGGTP